MKRLFAVAVPVFLITSACAPRKDVVQTAMAQTKQAYEASLATALAGTLAAKVPPTESDTPIPKSTSTPPPSPAPSQTPTLKVPAFLLPTLLSTPRQTWFDGFDDNSWNWDLTGGNPTIQNGALQLTNGNGQLGITYIPVPGPLKNSLIQVDINPSPHNDPSKLFFYGAGCRANQAGTKGYFYGLTPDKGGSGFNALFVEFGSPTAQLEIAANDLPAARNGAGFTATFTCIGTKFTAGPAQGYTQASNAHLNQGYIYLGIFQEAGIQGSVSFDNLTVVELP